MKAALTRGNYAGGSVSRPYGHSVFARSPLAGRKIVSLREPNLFHSFPFVLTEPSFGLRRQLDGVFAQHGFDGPFCVTNSWALANGKWRTSASSTTPFAEVCHRTKAGKRGAEVEREISSDALVFSIC
jgi:hypothetical protein